MLFLKGSCPMVFDLRSAARCNGPFPEPARITPYPTGRLFWDRPGPRHFVPGYDRTVPPGHFANRLHGRTLLSTASVGKARFEPEPMKTARTAARRQSTPAEKKADA
jgi:hypothetical protein